MGTAIPARYQSRALPRRHAPEQPGTPGGPVAALVYGHHPVHGQGWFVTTDLETENSSDDYFIPGERDNITPALRIARQWLARAVTGQAGTDGGGQAARPGALRLGA